MNLLETFVERVVLANRAAIFAVLLAMTLSIVSPYFLTSANLTNLLDQVVVFTAVALAATFILGAGEIDLSIIGVVPLVGAVMAKLMVEHSWPVPGAIAAGIVVGAGCGMANALLIALLRLPSFIVTFAMGVIFQGVMYVLTDLTSISGLPQSFIDIGQTRIGIVNLPVLLLLPVIAVMLVLQRYSVFSQHLTAMADSPEAVKVAGISVNWLRFKLFTMMGVISAFAAVILTARSASAQVSAGQNLLLLVIAAVVIGGTPITGGRIMVFGTVFGCLTIGMVNNGLNLIGFPTTFQQAMQGLLILLALYVESRSGEIRNSLEKRAMRRKLVTP